MARKIKTVIIENGFEREVEIEVPDGPPASWGDVTKTRILGRRNPRPEGPLKVSGRAVYASDVVQPGLCYARFLVSPHAAAKIVSIDITPAERMPGVKGVEVRAGAGASMNYHGQPIAAVAAITPEIAEDAIRAIKIEWETRPHEVNWLKAPTSSVKVRDNAPGNLIAPQQRSNGTPDEAMAQAEVVHEETYLAQTRLHCCLETHGHTARWDGDKLTIWSSTQYVEGIRNAFAEQAGGRENVSVICEHMGGGFGSKFAPGPEGEIAVALAKRINAPVKFMLTRLDEQLANYRGPGLRAKVRMGASRDGVILSSFSECWADGGYDPAGATPLDRDGYYIIVPKNSKMQRHSVVTNTGGTAALRAPGHPQAALIWDMALDGLAARLNMDPLELRRKNNSDPVRLTEWEIGARIIGWDRRNATPGAGSGVKKRGIGMGNAQWGGGGRKSSDCTLKIGRNGVIQSLSGTQDLGTGLRLYQSAIVAEELGLELKDVVPMIGHSEYGPGHASGGSTTTGSAAPPIKMAAMNAKLQLLAHAAKQLNASAEDLEMGMGGKVALRNNPARSLTWKQLCATLPPEGMIVKGEWNADLQAGGVAGCTFAEVEVDTETGSVEILKTVGVQDCGFVLNRLQAESQVTGGIIQGIGTALLEERVMDDQTGRMLNPNFEEYKLCGSFEAGGVNVTMDPPYRRLGDNERAMVTVIYDNPTGKVMGIGEPAVIGVQAAIANAIYNAIGVQVTEMPATPNRVLDALSRRKA